MSAMSLSPLSQHSSTHLCCFTSHTREHTLQWLQRRREGREKSEDEDEETASVINEHPLNSTAAMLLSCWCVDCGLPEEREKRERGRTCCQ